MDLCQIARRNALANDDRGGKSFHVQRSDVHQSPVFIKALQTVGVMAPLERRRGLAIADACVRTFLGVYLKSASREQRSNLPSLYLELQADFRKEFSVKQ
jgi:hypothetical protein